MKTFHCTHCQNLVFFENVKCLSCHHELAFLPEQLQMAALERDRTACGIMRATHTSSAQTAPTTRSAIGPCRSRIPKRYAAPAD